MKEHPEALFVIETLSKAGYVAYYAGGWVRDYLMGLPSDDIDIATNAPPDVIQTLFPKTVPIGIAFGIVLVIIDGHQFEVATFRSDFNYIDGRRPERIEFTTAEEDAKRRDFTINGMFYDPLKNQILDFVDGKIDLEKKILRAIGNPSERIREDRLRMIRAVRLSCRFHLTIEPQTEAAIRNHAKDLLPAVAIERIVQELEKGHTSNRLREMLEILHDFGILSSIFPKLNNVSQEELKKRIEPIRYFPHKTPLIGFLLELFPEMEIKDQLELCKSLKLPSLNAKFALFLTNAKQFCAKTDVELSDWAHLYAHPFSALALPIIAAHFDETKKEAFLKDHEKKIFHLQAAIERIVIGDLPLKAQDLIDIGIKPGQDLGKLLKLAEKISINESTTDKKILIEKLKQRPEWPL